MDCAMNKIFGRTKLIFLGIFAVAVVAIWGYQYFYVWPGQRCEAMGRWWAQKERICGVPVRISTLTGRPDPVKPKAPAATPATSAAPDTAPAAKPAP
jgi:hypothetical protein